MRNRYRNLQIILSIVIFIIVLLIVANYYFSSSKDTSFTPQALLIPATDSSALTQVNAGDSLSSLNGLPISVERKNLPVVAVMIENSPPSRPQSGLNKADVIYETLAEGGITRFMALFQSKDVETLGPVRSARTYFAEIVREYDAWYGHVGGNADALTYIAKNGLHDLNQFAYDKPFWRDPVRRKERGLEHSMYTNTNDLRTYVKPNPSFLVEPWSFTAAESLLADRPTSASIIIKFSLAVFEAEWKYDQASNLYLRSTGGVVQKDAQSGEQLAAKNVVVQYVSMIPVAHPAKGDEGALDITVIGKGEGILFRDGQVLPLVWEKKSGTNRTEFYDKDGVKIAFNPGVTWIELVEKGKVSYS